MAVTDRGYGEPRVEIEVFPAVRIDHGAAGGARTDDRVAGHEGAQAGSLDRTDAVADGLRGRDLRAGLRGHASSTWPSRMSGWSSIHTLTFNSMPSRCTGDSTTPPYPPALSPSARCAVPSRFLDSVMSSLMRAAGLRPIPNSPMLVAPGTPSMSDRKRAASGPPSTRVARPSTTWTRIGSSSLPTSVITRSKTIVPLAVPSTGGNETSPPGKADTSPGRRTMPVYQPRGSRCEV